MYEEDVLVTKYVGKPDAAMDADDCCYSDTGSGCGECDCADCSDN